MQLDEPMHRDEQMSLDRWIRVEAKVKCIRINFHGWVVAGWLDQLRIKLSQISTKLKFMRYTTWMFGVRCWDMPTGQAGQ